MKIGVLGGGQLGRMLALAGYPMGFRFRVLDRSDEAPAGQVAELVAAEFTDERALLDFASGLDLLTYEFENVPVHTARFLSRKALVYPPPEALEAAQDRLTEKQFFERLGIPVPPFFAVESLAELEAGIAGTGLPAVLKTRRFGYDGKGQFILRNSDDAAEAWRTLKGAPLLLESFVKFDREVSIIAVRGSTTETAFYPLVENHHERGMLRISIAPARALDSSLQALAERYATLTLEALNYVGVLAIEFFQVGGELFVNEMAPRVHNSGHWTIEGAETSQFENHLRAIAGLPLGSTAARGVSGMLNLIGTLPDTARVLEVAGAHLHLYGKAARPNRKLGHVTVTSGDGKSLKEKIDRLSWLVSG
ncbi:MAG TPA: 5-(carboxyamino)imidazole ribonucleotide synthase [Blastocatellia bacterium]|nr:5-(carboxyamino)imidazole ribonucleotide synthase [Blastocatellia bacterium]